MDDKLPDGEKPSNVGTIYGPGAVGREPPRLGEDPDLRPHPDGVTWYYPPGPRSQASLEWRTAFEKSMATAKRYSPSERGHLVARLIDDEAARVPWTPPSRDLTDDDFNRVRALLDVIVDAVETGDRDVLGRLGAALDVLQPPPKTVEEKLVDYLRWITSLHVRFREGRGLPVSTDGLARWVDPRFANIKRDRLVEALSGIVDDPEGKGGAGNKGVTVVGAELAVEVDAFDSATGDYDRDVKRLTDRLKQARSKAKRKASE